MEFSLFFSMATMNQQWAGYDYTQYQYQYDANGQPTGYYDAAGTFHYYDYSQYYQGQDYTAAADGTPNSNTQSEYGKICCLRCGLFLFRTFSCMFILVF